MTEKVIRKILSHILLIYCLLVFFFKYSFVFSISFFYSRQTIQIAKFDRKKMEEFYRRKKKSSNKTKGKRQQIKLNWLGVTSIFLWCKRQMI